EQIEQITASIKSAEIIMNTNKIVAMLLRWIIYNQQPFFVIENKKFNDLVAILNPWYKLPSRQTISIKIQELYEKQYENLKNYFKNHDSKMTYTHQAYMLITFHWIDNKWKMYHILLDLVPLHERHTGKTIANTVYNTINYFDLEENIISVTTDNASNMDIFKYEFEWLLFENHGNILFHYVRFKDGLDEVGLSIKKVREFTSSICSSQNLTYTMIEKLCKIRDITDILVTSNPSLRNTYPTDDDWEELDMIVELLKLIYYATNLLFSSSYLTLEDLHMIFLIIIHTINEAQNKNKKYWDELKETFYESVVLDPNNKLIYFCKSYGVVTNNDSILKEYLVLPVEEVDVLDYWKVKSTDS
ncbi:12142_t:CDS:2, partial [Cetraspora pellucida]